MVWTALLQILSSSFVFPAQKEGSPTFYPHTVATIVYISSIFLRIHNMSIFDGYSMVKALDLHFSYTFVCLQDTVSKKFREGKAV